jgi:hypothetical protein
MFYHVRFSFSSFVIFLAIFQVLQCVCFILHVFQFSLHIPGPIMISSVSSLASFLVIFKFLQCVFFILHYFQCFLPYVMSYHVSFSFSSFVSFLTILPILQCAFLIFHVFQWVFFCHISCPKVCFYLLT